MIIKHTAAYVAVLAMTASLAACSSGESNVDPSGSQAQSTGAALATLGGEAAADANATTSSSPDDSNRRYLDDNVEFVMVESELVPIFSQEAVDNLEADGTEMTYLFNDGEMEAFGRARTPEEAVSALEVAKKYLFGPYYDGLVEWQSSDDQTLIDYSDLIIPSVDKNDSSITVGDTAYYTTGIERPIRITPTDGFSYASLATGDGGMNYVKYIRNVTYTVETTTATISLDVQLEYHIKPDDTNHWIIYRCASKQVSDLTVVPN